MNTQFEKGHTPWNKGKKMKSNYQGFQKGHGFSGGGHRRGVKISEEAKKKISKSLTGIKRPPRTLEHRRKISKSLMGRFRGEKSPSWKGGKNSIKNRWRGSMDYKIWRDDVFGRDGYICQMPWCKSGETYLEAHHIKMIEHSPELIYNTNNGITLCRKCHRGIRRREELFEKMFKEILICYYQPNNTN